MKTTREPRAPEHRTRDQERLPARRHLRGAWLFALAVFALGCSTPEPVPKASGTDKPPGTSGPLGTQSVGDGQPKQDNAPGDADGDAISDDVDACRSVPGVADPDAKKNGCPPDRDNDSIADTDDACPDKWGVPDPDPKKHGCPKRVVLTDTEILILQQVQFDASKSAIRPKSEVMLDEVSTALKDHPEITKLEVQGHTDNKEQPAQRQKLSQARADAVKKALVDRGINEDRLTIRGYGPDAPIAENTTDAGKQLNRRVQFRIIEKDMSRKISK